ncbi:MAG: beta strand repeat-containing protein [Candidatus Acidiferrales bacterium]
MKTRAQKCEAKNVVPTFSNRANHDGRRQLLALAAMIAALSAAIGLSSCAGYTTNAAGTTGSQGGSATGTLSASSTILSFGGVVVGSSNTLSVSVTNTGTATVNVSQAAVSGAAFSVVGGNPSSTIPAGQSSTLQIRFAPQSAGAATGSLAITSDATDSPMAISLAGTGTLPTLTLSPTALNFNNVTVGQTSSESVTLINNGNANLLLTAATVTGNGFAISGLSLPKTLPAGQSTTLGVQFTPSSTSAASGSISFTDNSASSPQTLLLTGSAVAAGGTLSANPGSYNFGSVVVGSSANQTITLKNSGAGAVTIDQVGVTGTGFSTSGISAGQTIAPGAQASFTAAFAPTAAGNTSGTVTIHTSASNPTLSIALSGTGTQGVLSANPSSINFGSLLVASTGSVSVTLTNSGTAPVALSAASASGTGFTMSGFTAGTVNPGATSSFTVTFAPKISGSASGTVSVTSNAPGSPLKIGLSGTATTTQPQLSINPSSVPFSNVNVGSNVTKTVTLTNTGSGALNITAATISGSAYTMTLAPTTINAGASTTFSVTFAPTAAGSAAGNMSITSNAPGSPASIALSGTGLQGSLSANPATVNFGSILVGSSNSASVTLSNTGTAPISVSAASVSGTGFTMSGFTAGTVNPGASSSFSVTFAPKTSGSASGTVSVTSNAPGSPLKITLSGTATATQPQLSISPSSMPFSNVNVGSNTSQTVTLTNTGNAALNITAASISGSGYTMTLAPTTIIAGANTTFSVTFAPTAEGSAAGNISVTSNAPGSPASIALSGTGLQALGSANPTSIAFGNVIVGNNNSEVIALKNTGNSTLSFSQVNISGSGFSISGLTTSSTIAAGASLNFNAAFAPTSANPSNGTITLSTNGSPAQISIPLTGTGTSATKSLGSSSSSLSFGNVQVGNSNTLTAILTNTGNANVTISGVTVTGTGYTTSGISAGMILTPNQTATLTVKFAPIGLGSDPGSVSIASDATSSPAISLTGESHTVLLSWTASTSTGVTGYYVYRGTQSGQYTKVDLSSQATGTQFTDATVAAGTTYYYVVTAVADGVESPYSSPTTVNVP